MAATLGLDAETGAEVRIETGTGWVRGLEYKGRNVGVTIESDNKAMRLPVKGWADSTDAELIATLTEALRETAGDYSGARVAYRIVTHRKAQVDPSIPLGDLNNMDKVRDFVAATLADGQPGKPAPSESPDTATSRPNPPAAPSAAPTAAETGNEAHAARCAAMDERQQARQAGPAPSGSTATPGPEVGDSRPAARRGVKVHEEKRWEAFNRDGSLNPGSYAFAASQRAVSHAGRLFRMWLREEAGPFQDGGEDQHAAPDVARCKAVARHLLNAADDVQAAVRVDGHSDRMDASHNAALSAVVDASFVYPPPFAAGGDPAAVKAWRAGLTEYAAAMLLAARDLTAEAVS